MKKSTDRYFTKILHISMSDFNPPIPSGLKTAQLCLLAPYRDNPVDVQVFHIVISGVREIERRNAGFVT